jgi:hypothetical protein
MRRLFLSMLLFFLALPVEAQESKDERIQKAIEFLRTACVTKGSSLDFKVQGDGALRLRGLLGSGIKGSITLSKKELEGFADAASELSAQQASEMRKCMKPYIDRILGVMLSGHSEGNVEAFEIRADRNIFKTKEFDKIISFVANNTVDGNCNTVQYISRSTRFSKIKVRYYTGISFENGMMNYSYSCPRITNKGIKYVLSKGLAG